jgi:hypothetical protein
VDTLERRIGINLFPKLTDTAKQRVMELPEPRIRGRK